jgi:hypothetical protein
MECRASTDRAIKGVVMNVYTLEMQLEWVAACLKSMKEKGRPQREVTLQECVVDTIADRIREKRA